MNKKINIPKWMRILINIDSAKNQWQIQNDSDVSSYTCSSSLYLLYNKNIIEIDYHKKYDYRNQKFYKPQKGKNKKYVLTPKGQRVFEACKTIINELEQK